MGLDSIYAFIIIKVSPIAEISVFLKKKLNF